MKVLNPRSALLSDYEVLLLLQEMENEQQGAGVVGDQSLDAGHGSDPAAERRLEETLRRVPENLRTVQYETMSTLMQPWRPCMYQSAEHIQSFHAALKAAGFIGGRRPLGGKDDHDCHGDAAAAAASSSSSSRSKRKSLAGSDRRRKRARRDADDDDPAMRSPPPGPDASEYGDDGGARAGAAGAGGVDRGPEEILPDRALTKAERLQIVNHAPRSIVELHTLVEELSVRFTESQIAELMNLIFAHIPIPPTEDEALNGAVGGVGGEGYDAPGADETGAYYDEGQGEEDLDAMANAHADADATVEDNGLFFGGGGYGGEDDGIVNPEDEDAWANDGGGQAGGDDLADGGNDDDEE